MSVVLFRQPDFGGRTTQIGTSVSSLPNSDDNRADSVTVKETPWMLYTRPNFEGSLSILDPGEYRNPEEMGIPSDTISSLRPFPIPNTNSILLFEVRPASSHCHACDRRSPPAHADMHAYAGSNRAESRGEVSGTCGEHVTWARAC